MTRRSIILQACVWLAAVAAVVACYWHHAQNVSRMRAAADNFDTCQELAARIERARHAPRRAQLTTRSLEDLGTVLEKAAAGAQLSRDRLLRIDPQPAKRLGKTDYLEQATEVELVGVSLRQMVEFLYNLRRGDEQLTIGTLRLRTPHGTADSTESELWLADVVLAQRIYAPANVQRE